MNIIRRLKLERWRAEKLFLARFKPLEKESFLPFANTNSIFIHVPKTAGISITQSLYGCDAGSHATVNTYVNLFGLKRYESMFKFTISRHPVDRTESAYHYLKSGGMNQADQRWADRWLSNVRSFDQFCHEVLLDPDASYTHIRTQSHFFNSPAYKSERDAINALNYIGKFENLEQDFDVIKAHVRPDAVLPVLNSSKREIAEPVSSSAQAVIEKVYKCDFENFGY